jgi:hypothetical protein
VRDAIFVTGKLTESFANPKVPGQCPFILLVNAGHRRDIMLENEESEVMGNGMRKIQVTCQSKHIFHYKVHVNSVPENNLSP